MKSIPVTQQNKVFAFAALNFTHDYSGVKIDSVMIDRNGKCWKVTKIDKDDCGRRQFWSDKTCLCIEYNYPHNMLTKSPFYAYEFSA